MNESSAGLIGAASAAALTVALLAGLFFVATASDLGQYALLVFIGAPLLQGWAVCSLCRWLSRTASMRTMGWAALSGAMLCSGLLLVGVEGVICVFMAMPIWVPCTMLGAWMTENWSRGSTITRGVLLCVPAALPFAIIHDVNFRPAVQRVVTDVTIHAPPSVIWPLLKNLSGYQEPSELLFRAGVAYPVGTETHESTRFCRMSTGDIVEEITLDEPLRKLYWRVLSMPETMRETSLYGAIHPPHLKGVFVLREGGFQLTPLPNGETKLSGFTTYSNAMAPETYWDLWCRAVVRDVQVRVMSRIKSVAESANREVR